MTRDFEVCNIHSWIKRKNNIIGSEGIKETIKILHKSTYDMQIFQIFFYNNNFLKYKKVDLL
jgi:hypothetical protein